MGSANSSQVARLIGGAGTGKTTELISLLGKISSLGISLREVGFSSFTRAARREAAERAAAAEGIDPRTLTDAGWFRTLHSAAFRCIGASKQQMLTDDAASRRWIEEATGQAASPGGDELASDRGEPVVVTDADRALTLWTFARNKLLSLADAWAYLGERNALSFSRWRIEEAGEWLCEYERAKREAGRTDFTDLLAAFAGWSFHPECEPNYRATPQGDCPQLAAWFLDEAQDTSPLAWSAFNRLAGQPSVRWVYLAGDPYQAIYDWAGAEHRLFMEAEVDKEKITPQSFRCPPEVLEAGEMPLKNCVDYRDRGILPRGSEPGFVRQGARGALPMMIEDLPPNKTALILARTNRIVGELTASLNRSGRPWLPTRGNGGWHRPTLFAHCSRMYALENGETITAEDWAALIEWLPTSKNGSPGITRGLKSKLDADSFSGATINASTLTEHGANESLPHAIVRGAWPAIVKEADAEWCGRWRQAVKKPGGLDEVERPRIQCGTIHSVKGAEADIVFLLSTSNGIIEQNIGAHRDCFDAERRLAYVGYTRAREGVYLLRDSRAAQRGIESAAILEGVGE